MRRWTLAAMLALGITGCSTYDPYYYNYAYYAPYYYGYDTWVTYSWVDPYGVYYLSAGPGAHAATGGQRLAAPIDVNAAASAIASRANTFFNPAGCVTATASGAVVSYVFNNCSGGLGISSISGDMSVTVSDNS